MAFGLETTGLTPVVDRIVEIGAVRFSGNQVIDTFDELVDPLRPISHGAPSLNQIMDEMEITYRDARGILSARTVTTLSLGVFKEAVMMEVFCHLRKGKRNFRLDRVVEIR